MIECTRNLQIQKANGRPMLGACHLFIGVLIGLVLSKHLGDKRLILFAGLGALLPDLVDKPLGHLLLEGSVDFGRIYCHTLLFCMAFMLLGIVMLKRKRSCVILAISIGIASHLILDSMWTLPLTLFYPFLGDFGPHYYPNYFEISFQNEVLSPFEWLFLFLSIWIILRAYHPTSSQSLHYLTSVLDRSAMGLIMMLWALAIAYMISALTGIISVPSLENAIMLGVISVLGATVLAWMVRTDYAGMFKANANRISAL